MAINFNKLNANDSKKSIKPADEPELAIDEKKEKQERLDLKADEARQARAGNLDKATEDALVADVLRVANDEDNPYEGTCSRARYKQFGHYGEEQVFDLFGNHSELQRSAGLRDFRATTSFRNKRARIKTEERIQEYFKSEIMPYVGKYERKSRGKTKHMVVGSDFHSEHTDRFALSVFLDVIERTQPDYVVLNGDVFDFPAVSKWSSPPNKLLVLQDEIDWVRENILEPVRKAAPDADITLVIGNHEFRLCRFLADCAPALASLRSLSFNSLFGLDELEINLVHNNALLAPSAKAQKKSYEESWRIYDDCFVVTHGTAAGLTAGAKELAKWQMSGTSGHVHRPSFTTMPTIPNPYACWQITGMMAKAGVHGKEFVQGANSWTTGFGFVTIDSGIVLQNQVLIKNGIAEFGGKIYREV